jgi:hypothetical protein
MDPISGSASSLRKFRPAFRRDFGGQDVTSRAPQIEWRKVCGIRDVLAHAYFGVDLR